MGQISGGKAFERKTIVRNIAFSNEKKISKGNPVRAGNCPATVKGAKAKETVIVKSEK